MEELLSLQKKYNITDKDLYILSKLEDDKKKYPILEKEKLNAKQRNILSKYNIGFADKIKIFKTLNKSTFHNDLELIEKYKDSENSEELNEIGKKGKTNFIVAISIFIVIMIIISLNANKKTNGLNNKENISSPSEQPCENMDSYNQGVKEGRLQRGVLIDCQSYYPYDGWADNKECFCEGFNVGKNQ